MTTRMFADNTRRPIINTVTIHRQSPTVRPVQQLYVNDQDEEMNWPHSLGYVFVQGKKKHCDCTV